MRMNVRRMWPKNLRRRLLIGGAALLVIGLGLCAYFRIHSPKDVMAYYGMAHDCHPVWKQFALRRFGLDDPVDDLLRRFPPSQKDEYDNYAVYLYWPGGPAAVGAMNFVGLIVVARNGRLFRAAAWGCTWEFTFFATKDPAVCAEHAAALVKHIDKSRRESEAGQGL